MFNVRVYGIMLNERDEILVSDELIKGNKYTKFCGGGMEIGEGTIDCVIREFREEMNLKIEVIKHIYTTDFYQKSAFNPNHQLISIYYQVRELEPIQVELKKTAFDFNEAHMLQHKETGQAEVFRFIPWDEFGPDTFSFPIDKIVAEMIKTNGLLRKTIG
jgi:ADP-ribose pyrophosphatase YjhB (NUDIX family)